jgi:pimeloyl-ACP methyl ester carboxylesterase
VLAIDSAGAGAPLVLLHGVGTSKTIWSRALPRLAERRRALAPDLPGFGASAPAGHGFDLARVADALADGLAPHVEAPFDLVGNSLGGAVAVVLALHRPELVHRLVLVAPAGFAPYPAAVARAVGEIGARLTAARRTLGPPIAGRVAARRVLLWGVVGDPARLSAGDARTMLRASRGASCIAEAIAAVMVADLRPRLAELAMPWGLMWGDRDRVVRIATLSAIRAVAPQVPVETLRGAGHVPHFECPGDFAAALERLLERLDPVGGA